MERLQPGCCGAGRGGEAPRRDWNSGSARPKPLPSLCELLILRPHPQLLFLQLLVTWGEQVGTLFTEAGRAALIERHLPSHHRGRRVPSLGSLPLRNSPRSAQNWLVMGLDTQFDPALLLGPT